VISYLLPHYQHSGAAGNPVAITRQYLVYLPRDALQCKAWSCYRMLSVCLSIRLSVCVSVTLVDHDHIGGKSWKGRLKMQDWKM